MKLVLGRLFQQILGHVGNGVDDDAADLVLLARRDGHEVLVELGLLFARVADPPGRDLDFARHVERVKDELPHAAVVALGVCGTALALNEAGRSENNVIEEIVKDKKR